MSGRARPRRRAPSTPVALAIALTLLGAGVVSASLLLNSGNPETEQGTSISQSSLPFWQWHSTSYLPIPAGLTAASSRVAIPTILSGSTAASLYRIGPATTGNDSVAWNFTLTTTSPISTELELNVSAGGSGATLTATVYLETPAVAPGADETVAFYFDLGPAGPTAVTLATVEESTSPCASIGNCP